MQSFNDISNLVHDTILTAIELKQELDRVQTELSERQIKHGTLSGRHAEQVSLLERRLLANDEREKIVERTTEIKAILALIDIDTIQRECDELNEEFKQLESHETNLMAARQEIECEIDGKLNR